MIKKIDILDSISSILLKVFFVIALFCPISTTMEGARYYPYYPEFLLVNAVAVFFWGVYILSLFAHRRWNRENKVFCVKFFVLIILYYFFYRVAQLTIQWDWQGWNGLVSFGLFLFLMMGLNMEWIQKHRVIRFINRAIVVSHVVAILVYLKGNLAVYWYDFKLKFITDSIRRYGEIRYNWIYVHKSQYALMVLLAMAFIITYRKEFYNKITFIISLIILEVAICISHTNAAIVGSLILLTGFVLDYLVNNYKKMQFRIRVLGSCITVLVLTSISRILFLKIQSERSIIDLGGRVYIWKHSIETILNNARGIGNQFTLMPILIPEWNGQHVTNAHNFFLNEFLRFSIPVGICFTMLFILIITYSLEKKFSFLTVGIWVAVIISWMMDYAVLVSGWTLMLIYFYFIFFIHLDQNKELVGGKKDE